MESYREEKKNIKRSIYQSKKKISEHFVRKMNEDVEWKKEIALEGGK